jgi:hypothetical protein
VGNREIVPARERLSRDDADRHSRHRGETPGDTRCEKFSVLTAREAVASALHIDRLMRTSAAAVLMLGALVFCAPACSSEGFGDEDGDVEDEVVDTSSDAIVSTVDCRTTRQTAYERGRSFGIDVIKIGGKPASKPTGHAFLKMQAAAHAAGVRLVINSGFRTNAEQQYFYGCYQSGNCNNGNLAARPGYSNHQSGRALDLTTSTWLANNASRFGFKRTVPSEAWHYEYMTGTDPGGPCP